MSAPNVSSSSDRDSMNSLDRELLGEKRQQDEPPLRQGSFQWLVSIDEVALAELLESQGWHRPPSSNPQLYTFCTRPTTPPIPSPFAPRMAPSDDSVLASTSSRVRKTWRGLHRRPQPEFEISNAFKNGSRSYCGVYLRGTSSSSGKKNQNAKERMIERYYPMNTSDSSWDFCLADFVVPGLQDTSLNEKFLRLRRLLRQPGTSGADAHNEGGFFIVNQDCDRLVVNSGEALTRGAVVGPLPDFATIEIDSVVVFWWRNPLALSYEPKYPRRADHVRSGLESLGSESPSANTSTAQSDRSSKKRRGSDDDLAKGDQDRSKKVKVATRQETSSQAASSESQPLSQPQEPTPGKQPEVGAPQTALQSESPKLPEDTAATVGDSRSSTPSASQAQDQDTGSPARAIQSAPPSQQPSQNTRSKVRPSQSEPPSVLPALERNPGSKTSATQPPRLSPTPADRQKRWQHIFDDGMEKHRRCRKDRQDRQKQGSTDNLRHIESSTNMLDDDILLIIATFWEGLRRRGGCLFAFAGGDVFLPKFGDDPVWQVQGAGVVGAPHDFIMPVLFDAEVEGNESESGHYVLAVGQWNEYENEVSLSIWDSYYEEDKKRQQSVDCAKKLILDNDWPRRKAGDHQERPRFANEVNHKLCPKQQGTRTCGLYLILNAWCKMLGIPVIESNVRRTGNPREFKRFLNTSLEIINLALIGCMDAVTLQAFLSIEGYTDGQDPNAPVPNVSAAMMNEGLFLDALYEQQALEYPPSEEKMQTLRDLFSMCTNTEIRDHLIRAGGDDEVAADTLASAIKGNRVVTDA